MQPGFGWITALTSGAIRALMEKGALQLSLLDEKNLAETTSPDYPWERLMVCHNPLLKEDEERREERRRRDPILPAKPEGVQWLCSLPPMRGPANALTVEEMNMYPEEMVQPMREDLTRVGFREMRTAEEVDALLGNTKGTTLLVVNSICGCAAGKARPAVALALEHPTHPDTLATVFAGQDQDATARARSYITGYEPSSPSIALLQDGKTVFMLERRQIEGRPAEAIAEDLVSAFDHFCSPLKTTVAQ